jgi:ribosomal protein L7/L12
VVIAAGAGAIMRFLAGRGRSTRSFEDLKITSRLNEMERKLDALLKHQGVVMPPPPASGLSPEVEQLARDPQTKIAAIKLYRDQNPGTALAQAKERIEAFYESNK